MKKMENRKAVDSNKAFNRRILMDLLTMVAVSAVVIAMLYLAGTL